MATSGIDRIQFNPAAKPIDTVGVDTSFQRMAAPVNTAAAIQAPTPDALPQKPEDSTSSAQALIAALSNFGSVTKAFLDERDDNKKQADIVSGGLAAMNRSEGSWADAVNADPNLASESPWFRKSFTESIVKTSVSKRIGELQAEYATSGIANSTDPGAVQAWFTERMKDTLSKYTDPDSRKAALETAKEAAEKFAAAHTKNATANLLVQADKAGAQGFSETLDAQSASSGTVPGKVAVEIAAKDITPTQRAFLKATAYGESPSYGIRYGGVGSAGKSFDITGAHPGIMEATKDGRKSSAAGLYQFTVTTWKGIWNGENPVMTPENQDKAALALAAQDYRRRTKSVADPKGRDIWSDLDKYGFNSTVQNKMAPTWESQHSNQDRRSALFNQELQRGGGQVAEHPQAQPDYDAAQSKIYKDRDALVSGGQNVERVNGNLVQSVVNMALRSLDPAYLKMLDHTDANGMKLSANPDVQKQVLAAEGRIHSLSVERDNQKRLLEDRRKSAQLDKIRSAAFIKLEEGFRDGKPQPFSSDQLIQAAKLDASLAEKMQAMNDNLSDRLKQEDPAKIATAQLHLFSGRTQLNDVPDLIASGVLKDPATIKQFYEQARQNQTHSYLDSSVYRSAVQNIGTMIGDPMNINMEKAQQKVESIGEVRRAFDQFMTENPKASPKQQADFLDDSVKSILGTKLDIKEWKTPAAAAPKEGQQASAGAPKAPPGMSAPVVPAGTPMEPARTTDTQKTFVFGKATNLEQAFNAWRADPSRPSLFKDWLQVQGISDTKQAVRWYLLQKSLASTGK